MGVAAFRRRTPDNRERRFRHRLYNGVQLTLLLLPKLSNIAGRNRKGGGVKGIYRPLFEAAGLKNAKKEGLCIPVVWNTSAYETEETVALLSPVVDGWLPDIKTFDSKTARLLFNSEDYPETAAAAILKMAESTPLTLQYGRAYPFGKMESGVIVRHLALPGCLKDTENILRWYARLLKEKTLLSLMTQYTPIKARALTGFSDGHFGAQTDGISAVPPALKTTSFQNRMLCADDDAGLKRLLTELKIDSGFYQELNPSDGWLPDFNRIRTFSAELSKPIWHWTCGFIK